VVRRLNVTDCDNIAGSDQQRLQREFTICYFQIIGHQTSLTADQPLPSNLSPEDYSTYTAMKVHLLNLCHFARQSIFHEETSRKLITLFQSVLNSSNAVTDMKVEMGKASMAVNTSIADIQDRLKEGKDFIAKITTEINTFGATLNQTIEVLSHPLTHIHNVKVVLVLVIFLVFVAMFLPSFLLPVIGFTIVFVLAERFLRARLDDWDDSVWKIGIRGVYAAICLFYPLLTVISWIRSASQVVGSLSGGRQSPVTSLPRFGQVPSRKSPFRPRYY
jgi:hypothetical protein